MLNHVALTVRDAERSARFYGDHFGLGKRVHDDGRLLILGDGEGSLLALREGEPPADPESDNHFGFQLDSPELVRAARESLRIAGVAETEWEDGAMVRVQILDPDGYRVELFAY